MQNVKIGIIGLGNIAQKAYLPVLTKEEGFTLVGAYTPSVEKRKRICDEYRIKEYQDIDSLAKDCDGIFLHSSTKTHYEIIKKLLNLNVNVYVDKPLAETVAKGEELVRLSKEKNLKLMVGFNRRFVPMYKKIKEEAGEISEIRVCKHRVDSISNLKYDETLIDDYIHVVDTALWLCDGKVELSSDGEVSLTEGESLFFASYKLKGEKFSAYTSMHRCAGSNLEQVEILAKGKILRVKNVNLLEIEENGKITTEISGMWEPMLKNRGFYHCIHDFIDCLKYDKEPMINGEEGLRAQRIVEEIIKNH